MDLPFVDDVPALNDVEKADVSQDGDKAVRISYPIHGQFYVLGGVDLAVPVLLHRGVCPKHLEREDALKPEPAAQFLGLCVGEKSHINPKISHILPS